MTKEKTMNPGVSLAKQRLIERLKYAGGSTAADLAGFLELSDVAVRQHLTALENQQLVRQEKMPSDGRGRPAVLWSLTNNGQRLFPNRHADLTLSLISAIRDATGEDGLENIIASRARVQIKEYLSAMPPTAPYPEDNLDVRIRRLAAIRTNEGYMAEVQRDGDGWLLVENHCPICDAAKNCVGFCNSEAFVFSQVLPDAHIERTSHVLEGDTRCVYRITPKKTEPNSDG